MPQIDRWNGLLITSSSLVPEGMQLLWNEGAPVICVPIGAPIEDALCDRIDFNPADYERVRQGTRA